MRGSRFARGWFACRSLAARLCCHCVPVKFRSWLERVKPEP